MDGGPGFEAGQVVHGQKLIEKVGEGGFGAVWKAEYYGQVVAVKFFFRRDRVEGTRRESIAQYVLGRLKPEEGGRWFPRVEHFDLDAVPPYMRMEFVEGKSLQKWFKQTQRMDLPRAIKVGEDILAGLIIVHDMNFVHGDLSPSNIIVDPQDRVKLIDAGYGALFKEESVVVRSTDMAARSVGAATPMYSAPERFSSEFLTGDQGKRADIYSVGKILYQLLTWESPVTVKPVSRQVPSLDSTWDDFVYRCVADKPSERFADAREALAAFQALSVTGTVVDARRPASKPRNNLGRFRSLVEIAFLDRVMTDAERKYLTRRASEMGIDPSQATRIIDDVVAGRG